jgi:hypothetical protein
MSIGTSGGPLGYAYVRPLDVVSNINGRLAIPIKYHFPVRHGNSIKTRSALVKPFEKLMEEAMDRLLSYFIVRIILTLYWDHLHWLMGY